MIEELKRRTDELINKNQDNQNELKKYTLIKQILNTKDCFLNMDIEYAYSILRDLNIKESELHKTYSELIDFH